MKSYMVAYITDGAELHSVVINGESDIMTVSGIRNLTEQLKEHHKSDVCVILNIVELKGEE